MNKKLLIGLGLAALLGGCGAAGPWSPANAFNNYPPRVRSVGWVVPASCVVESHQPYTSTQVDVDGWAIRRGMNFDDGGTLRVHLSYNLRQNLDTVRGVGYFLIVDQDWGGWDDGRPLLTDMDHYLMIGVHDPDGQRVGVSLWRLGVGGSVGQVARAADELPQQDLKNRIGKEISMPTADFMGCDRLDLAKMIAAQSRASK